eukprot:CAMPEP_0172507940 /NCGR_PEP_ID=MMETSP1066-20121228/207955_1 /TAXON_ID=671091 /ORGANISM="Coscinodiscus wailesii, Strain CCMP2513" /LENGTH=402 /DNA_ID=CAMNT_0013285703 /DNA_START=182 /DNA_END=1386 /DNA_ORIENTATION=+
MLSSVVAYIYTFQLIRRRLFQETVEHQPHNDAPYENIGIVAKERGSQHHASEGSIGIDDDDDAAGQNIDGAKNASTEVELGVKCPLPDKSVDASFSHVMPQNLTFGMFRNPTGAPFITSDFWADIVDNRRTFFVRPTEAGFPTMKKLRDWIRSRPHPITLVVNNQVAKSWPLDLKNKDYELILNETNLHAVYALNPWNLENFPKLKPLPCGLKWQFKSTKLFGEHKGRLVDIYSKVSSSAEETKKLFTNANRTPTVWVRPMDASNTDTPNYLKNTPALATVRGEICSLLKKTAPKSVVCDTKRISQPEYFDKLRKHRFIVSPAGKGLDTHGTWEALLAGCIPIVPRSHMDSLYEGLPVWSVYSWEEVTDEAMLRVERELKQKTYKWKKVFQQGWKKEIYKGL